MSYAFTSPYGAAPPGLGFLNELSSAAKNQVLDDLKATGQATVDASKQQAIDYANQQLANYPEVGQVVAEFNKYAKFIKNPADFCDPEKCVGMMKDALVSWAAENGVPTNTAAAKAALTDYALKVAEGYIGFPVPHDWPTSTKELKEVAVGMACTAVAMQTGIDPKMVTVTVQCLLDGKLSAEDCKAIGTCAGSIAGAAIAQSFGIPAPIGSFIGGTIGAIVGETFAQIFGLIDPQEAVRKMEAAFADFEKATLAEAQRICMLTRSAYWDTFDTLLMATELQWRQSEVNIGWKFGIRWFGVERYQGAATGYPFSRDSSGAYTDKNRATLYNYTYSNVYAASGTLIHRKDPNYYCSYDYGCPYPVYTPGFGAGEFERDAQAYRARGAAWVPSTARATSCTFPLPPSDAAFVGASKDRWLSQVRELLNAEKASVQALQILSVTVIGDLVKTAASVAAEKAVTDKLRVSQAQLSKNIWDRGEALYNARKTGEQLTSLLNYGVVIVGVGVLGAVILKKRRQ